MPLLELLCSAPSPPVARIIADFLIHEIDPRRKKRGLSWSQIPKPMCIRIMAEAKHHGVVDTHYVRQWLDKDHAWQSDAS